MTESLRKKIERSIKLIKNASKIAQENGQKEIALGYSGGKDSDVILELTKMARVPYRAIHLVTTIDPPRTIAHAKANGCEINHPKMSFLEIIKKKGFPSRMNRFCCQILKERKVADFILLGIRADESTKRKERYKEPEQCRVYSKKEKCRQYFPILDWTNEDVLEFIHERGIKLHPLYYKDDGTVDVSKRLGCMGCPMQSYKHRLDEFMRYPNMVKFYVRGVGVFLSTHPRSRVSSLVQNGYELFCMDVICERSYSKFLEKFGCNNLFREKIDCKKFLEDFFHIKF